MIVCNYRFRNWLVVFEGHLSDVQVIGLLADVDKLTSPLKWHFYQNDGIWYTRVYFSVLIPHRLDYMESLFPDATVVGLRGGTDYGKEEK